MIYFAIQSCSQFIHTTEEKLFKSKSKAWFKSWMPVDGTVQLPNISGCAARSRNQRAPEAEAIFKQHSTVGEQRGGASIAGGCTTTTCSRLFLPPASCPRAAAAAPYGLLLLLSTHSSGNCGNLGQQSSIFTTTTKTDTNYTNNKIQKHTQIQPLSGKNTNKWEKKQTKRKRKTQTQCRKKCKWSIWGATSRSRLQSWGLRFEIGRILRQSAITAGATLSWISSSATPRPSWQTQHKHKNLCLNTTQTHPQPAATPPPSWQATHSGEQISGRSEKLQAMLSSRGIISQ